MGLRFLVVEGNTRGARLAHREAYGLTPSESYAEVIQAIERDAVCDIALPADEGANLPDAAGLESYDGIVLTGSHLNIYDRTPDDPAPDRPDAGGLCLADPVVRLLLGAADGRGCRGRRRAAESARAGSWHRAKADSDGGRAGASDARRPPGRL